MSFEVDLALTMGPDASHMHILSHYKSVLGFELELLQGWKACIQRDPLKNRTVLRGKSAI